MNRRGTAMVAVGAAAALAVALGGCGGDEAADHPMAQHGSDRDGGQGEQGSPDEPNTVDLMFARMMIPHHDQAIEMSDVILSVPGVSPDVVALAEDIKAAQQPEVALMQGWLDDWGQDGMGHGMDGMGDTEGLHAAGMLDPAEMAALRAASGPQAETLYLEGMIEHHRGAIEMAENELEDGQFGASLELARDIIQTQQAEIERMEELLR